MCSIVLVTPANDPDAVVLAEWGEALRLRAQDSHDVTPSTISRALGSRIILEQHLQSGPPEAVFFFGHGTWGSLNGEAPLIDGANVRLLSGKSVVAIACKSAYQLGEIAVEAPGGVRSYLGFDEDLRWVVGKSHIFGGAVVQGLEPLLDGESIGAARDELVSGFARLVAHYKYQEPRSAELGPWAYLTAFWDARHVKLCGDESTTLSGRQHSEPQEA